MRFILSLLLSVALTGCAAIGPDGPTASSIQGSQLGLIDSRIAWPTERWWQRYQDPQLNALVSEALAGSPSLAAAKARLDMANAAVRSARAVQFPQLNAAYNLVRERMSENYIYPPPIAGSMLTDNSLRLDLGLNLDLWGKQRSRHAAALSREQAATAELQEARNTLVAAAVQSYFNLQNALAQATVISRIVKQLENVSSVTRQRVVAGLDTEVEASQAESAVSAARVQLSQARTNAALLRNQLSALLAAGPARGADIKASDLAMAPTQVPAQIPLSLLGRRPDIVAAKHEVLASLDDISAARAEFFPDVNLSAFAGFMSLGLSNLFQGGSAVYGIGPAISLPIFHGGALNAQLDSRRAQRDLAVADYNETLLTAVREVADATAAIRALQQQRKDQAASYRAIRSAYDIAVQRYKSGLGNFVQVLLAQNEVQKQAILDTDLRVRAFNLDAQLATALGGGYAVPPLTREGL